MFDLLEDLSCTIDGNIHSFFSLSSPSARWANLGVVTRTSDPCYSNLGYGYDPLPQRDDQSANNAEKNGLVELLDKSRTAIGGEGIDLWASRDGAV